MVHWISSKYKENFNIHLASAVLGILHMYMAVSQGSLLDYQCDMIYIATGAT